MLDNKPLCSWDIDCHNIYLFFLSLGQDQMRLASSACHIDGMKCVNGKTNQWDILIFVDIESKCVLFHAEPRCWLLFICIHKVELASAGSTQAAILFSSSIKRYLRGKVLVSATAAVSAESPEIARFVISTLMWATGSCSKDILAHQLEGDGGDFELPRSAMQPRTN